MKPKYITYVINVLLISGLLSLVVINTATAFVSTSDGSDGALDFSWAVSNTKDARGCSVVFDPDIPTTFDSDVNRQSIDQDNDNVFHFTSILIPTGVTVCLRADKLNWQPVYWLSSGDVELEFNGILDLQGAAGHVASSAGEGRYSAMPGPGGFSGGLGASSLNLAQPGFGPGAGAPAPEDSRSGSAGHVDPGAANTGGAGASYGSPFLIPLIGGSGGAGAGGGVAAQIISRTGGGAGGGAILIASDTQVINNGKIFAMGGSGHGPFGDESGGGSGGAVRILTPKFSGVFSGCCQNSGVINVSGGANGGSAGRIRIEATNNTYAGQYTPDNSVSVRVSALVDTTPFLPSDVLVPGWPSVRVISVNAISLPAEPTASFELPDVTINSTAAVPVVFNTINIPTNAQLELTIISPFDGVVTVNPVFSAGDQASATWNANVAFPVNFSRGYIQAIWTPVP